MAKKNTHILQIPAQQALLHDVRQFVEAHTLLEGVGLDMVAHLVLATDEACTNIITHGYGGDSKNLIQITITISEKWVEVLLTHTGIPFNSEKYTPPKGLRASLMARKKGGWGIFIMEKLMDEVRFKSKNGTNQVKLVKYLR